MGVGDDGLGRRRVFFRERVASPVELFLRTLHCGPCLCHGQFLPPQYLCGIGYVGPCQRLFGALRLDSRLGHLLALLGNVQVGEGLLGALKSGLGFLDGQRGLGHLELLVLQYFGEAHGECLLGLEQRLFRRDNLGLGRGQSCGPHPYHLVDARFDAGDAAFSFQHGLGEGLGS